MLVSIKISHILRSFPFRTAWPRSCMLRIRGKQTYAGYYCSMELMSTVMSMSMAILLSCLPASQVTTQMFSGGKNMFFVWSINQLKEVKYMHIHSNTYKLMLRECWDYMDDAWRWGRDRSGELRGTDSSTNGSFCRWVMQVMLSDRQRCLDCWQLQLHDNQWATTRIFLSVLPGQHDCVTVINNFFSRTRLEYYTRPHGLEKEPILPPKLAGPLHKIIMTTNLNPVKVGIACKSVYCKNPAECILQMVMDLMGCLFVLL